MSIQRSSLEIQCSAALSFYCPFMFCISQKYIETPSKHTPPSFAEGALHLTAWAFNIADIDIPGVWDLCYSGVLWYHWSTEVHWYLNLIHGKDVEPSSVCSVWLSTIFCSFPTTYLDSTKNLLLTRQTTLPPSNVLNDAIILCFLLSSWS